MNKPFCIALLGLLSAPSLAQEVHSDGQRVPSEGWMQYASPAEAGFSAQGLAEARAYFDGLDAAAAMVIHDGVVLASWGEVERRFMCHSVRKSFMSALWGVYVDRGEADLGLSLAELGIDDMEPVLTEGEKRATILDLLKARSGVYRLAAYEPPQNPKPPRHSHEPGTFWCYNNWDFNTLVTIFQQQIDPDFFAAFGREIATPIGMQDYRPRDGYLHYEAEKSIHPAYPFRMSARDMARFGLLFLNEGRWGDQQVLAEQWVERSRTSYSDAGRGRGYGLLWWTAGAPDLKALGMYSALGYGGHAIDVLPGADLVLVFRVDTFEGDNVPSAQRHELLRKILAAHTGEPGDQAELVALESQADGTSAAADPGDPGSTPTLLPDALLARYSGTVANPFFSEVEVSKVAPGQLGIHLPNQGNFDLLPRGNGRFLIEDVNQEVVLLLDDSGSLGEVAHPEVIAVLAQQATQQGDGNRALELLRKNASLFPESIAAKDALREAETKAQAQGNLEPYATVDQTLDALYGAVTFGPGGECDWEVLREVFLPDAIFSQPPPRGEQRRLMDLDGFFADFRDFIANSPVKQTGFSEAIAHRSSDQFGDIAHAYVIFEPRLGGLDAPVAGRGMDSVQLVRIDGRWWVASITTQFERPTTPLPKRFLGED